MKWTKHATKEKIYEAEIHTLDGEELIRKVELLLRCPSTAGLYYLNGNPYLMGVFSKKGTFNVASIKLNELRSLFGYDNAEKIMNYIAVHRNFKGSPAVQSVGGIYRPDGKQIAKYSTQKVVKFKTEMAKVEVVESYPPVDDKDYTDLVNLIKIIFPKKKELELFMDFLAQFSFENRTDYARATLVLYGARGTGKNLVIEHLLSAIFPNLVSQLPPKHDVQTEYKAARAIILDEVESPRKREAVALLAKALSGSNVVQVKPKWGSPNMVKNQAYVIIMSNGRPLVINETPISDLQNQWIVFDMKTPLSEKPEFVALQQKYGDLSKMIQKKIGAFLKLFLLPYYEKKLMGRDIGRYGFRIPLNKAVQKLLRVNIDNMDSEPFIKIIEKIENLDLSEVIHNKEDVESHMRMLQNDMFFSTLLLRQLTDSKIYKDAIRFFRAVGLFQTDRPTRKHYGKVYLTGWVCDEGIYQSLLTPVNEPQEVEVNLEDFFSEV